MYWWLSQRKADFYNIFICNLMITTIICKTVNVIFYPRKIFLLILETDCSLSRTAHTKWFRAKSFPAPMTSTLRFSPKYCTCLTPKLFAFCTWLACAINYKVSEKLLDTGALSSTMELSCRWLIGWHNPCFNQNHHPLSRTMDQPPSPTPLLPWVKPQAKENRLGEWSKLLPIQA